MKNKHSLKNKRIFGFLLFFVTIIMFGLVGIRLTSIMVGGTVEGQDLVERVNRLYNSEDKVTAQRGTIFDKNDNPIAVDATSYKMVAVLTDEWSPKEKPIHVTEPEKLANILADHLAISYEKAYDKLTSDSSQVEFGSAGNNLSFDTVNLIKEEMEKADLKGLTFEESQTRLYPNGMFASHIIGLAQDADKDNQIKGVMGLEEQYNEQLTGQNGDVRFQKDHFGYALPNQKVEATKSVNGSDVHLTIDRRLQTYLENIMTQVEEEHSPKAMTATVMDSKTGEIIASTQRPSFNSMTKEGIDQSWQNLLVEYEYEPGSTLKIITLAAAIEEGVFDPNAFYQSGSYEVAGGRVRDVNPEGWGVISYLEGLYRSSNVSFVKLVEAMGYETWKSYLDAFGFGTPTGIELPNESSGENPYVWELQKVNTAFGQGITVTPVQMLQALTAITNEGQMIQPRIVQSVFNSNKNEENINEEKLKSQPISKETAEKTLKYLQMGVDSEVGTARGYRLDEVPVSAKTGTAQIVNPDTGKYYSSSTDFIFSVVTMFPSNDPQYTIYITVQQPELNNVGHGSMVVNKIFKPLSHRLLIQEGTALQTEDEEGSLTKEIPQFVESDTSKVLNQLDESGTNYSVVGTGDKIVQQYPYRGSHIYNGQRIILLTNGAMSMPDISGWSRNDVLKLAELTGLSVDFEGEGYVQTQGIPIGSFIETGDSLSVTLSSPNEYKSEKSDEEIVTQNPEQIWKESTFEEP